MKKLLYIILLLPLWVNAQTNGTIQKTSSTGTVRGSFGSLGLDTLPRVTGALVNGYILKYNASTNKWYASPDGYIAGLQDSLTKKANRTFDNVASGAIAKSKVDTTSTGLQTVSNFFPKGDTRYAKTSALGSYLPLSGGTMTGNISMNNAGDQWFQSMNVSSSGRKGLKLSNNLNIDMRISTGGNQTLGAFTEADNLMVYGTGYQGGGGGNEKHLWHSTDKGNMFSMNAATSQNTSYFPLLAPTATAGTNNTQVATTAFVGTALGSYLPLTGGTLSGALTGTSATFGNANIKTYFDNANFARFGHVNYANANPYGFLQNSTGTTFISGTTNEIFGNIVANSLSGSGNRIVVANGTNVLGSAVIGTGLAFDGTTLTASGGSGGTISGSGTSGKITKWTGSSAIGNSLLEDNGTNLFSNAYLELIRPLGQKALTIGESAGTDRFSIVQEASYGGNVLNSSNINLKLTSYNSGGSGGNIIFYTGDGSLSEVGRFNTAGNFVATGSITGSNLSGTNTGDQNLAPYATLASPAFTGTPTAPTQTAGDNSTKIATTAYVDTKFASTSSRILKDWYTDANNVTTGATDLYDYTVPANTLINNGDKLVFNISGIYANNSDIKTITVYFGGSNFALNPAPLSVAGEWVIDGTIIRTGATTYRINIVNKINGNSTAYSNTTGSVTNYTGTNVFKISGTGGASADITAQMGYLEFKPAAL